MGALTIMFYYSWRLTSVMLSVVPVVVIGAGVYDFINFSQ
jgi:ABC-type bacteriocin/lantibiotic exporter with double-glycine peptidase domain